MESKPEETQEKTQPVDQDRSHIDYQAVGLPPNDVHQLGGEKVAVPLGGMVYGGENMKIPESMTTMYDPEYIK